MATQLADILFTFVALAILVSQALILRSTARAMRYASSRTPEGAEGALSRNKTLEWLYAIVPAVALVALLWFSWKAMHPDTIQVQGVAPPARAS